MSERYAFIEAEKAAFPIARGCKLLQVSTSGYYAWSGRPLSPTALRRARLAVESRPCTRTATASRLPARPPRARRGRPGRVGAPGASGDARAGPARGAAAGLPGHDRPGSRRGARPDLLERDFTSSEPGTRLVGDITYIRTWAGWAYLAVVIDLATKMVVGWSVSNRATASLVVDALQMADRNGHLSLNAIFHTDRGSQGGFNRSSQHLDHGGVDGRPSGWRRQLTGQVADEVAGAAVASRGGGAAVLARDRQGAADRGGRGAVGVSQPVGGGGSATLAACTVRSGSAVGPLPVVRRARGDRDPARPRRRRARDRPAVWASSPSTISRELRRNAATRAGSSSIGRRSRSGRPSVGRGDPRPRSWSPTDGCATTCRSGCRGRFAARRHVVGGPARPRGTGSNKPHRRDRRWVQAWSPEQIANRLKVDFPDDESMRISHEAIYQALYIQGRGALKRELVACLRTGRALRVPRAGRDGRPGRTSRPR